ncbi:MAG: protein translocase subunit SecF, partial [Elusimicrobiota bacterium]|nr:protein translocase subunit SecF [Elusimicrobiota bacterium]
TITAGLFAALQVEVDLVIVAAFLTIAGYSINDTIVIFDRMREILRLRRGADLGGVINDSINEMRSRTLITNGMVFMVVVSLFALGGPVIHNFAFALLIGSIVGTYSTIGLATQLIYTWQGGKRRHEPASDAAPAVKVKEGRRRK